MAIIGQSNAWFEDGNVNYIYSDSPITGLTEDVKYRINQVLISAGGEAAKQVIEALNAERAKQGLPEITVNNQGKIEVENAGNNPQNTDYQVSQNAQVYIALGVLTFVTLLVLMKKKP